MRHEAQNRNRPNDKRAYEHNVIGGERGRWLQAGAPPHASIVI
jgi:hypothetical protein